MKTGNTRADGKTAQEYVNASMEPGHEDREYTVTMAGNLTADPPQWSPVMKTGNTARLLRCRWLPVLHTLARTATRHPQPMGGSAGRVDKNQP